MKKVIILGLAFIIIPILSVAQSITDIDFVSPIHNEVAAVQKDGKWAFIDKEGHLIIDFRTDLVTTNTENEDYPMFNDNRCPIVKIKAGISYFGFIDKTGKIVIEPQFLNTTDFENGTAMALKLDKELIARNTALGKDMVNYRYFEVLIDTNGKITYYLTQDGVNIVLDKDFLRMVPQITSNRITKDLYAVKTKKNSWNVINVKE